MKLREEKYIVYKITNIINNKIYIGKTSNLEKRWQQHLNAAKRGTRSYLYSSINKYGENNFKIDIIEICLTDQESLDKEIFWIKELNSRDPNIGMNLTDGGQGGIGTVWSEESLNKIKGVNNHNYNKNISQLMKKQDPNIFSGENNGFYGKKHSDEVIYFLKNRETSDEIKIIISEGCRGEKQWNAKFSDNDIIEIRRKWDNGDCSQAELARQYGVKRNTINQIVRRKRWKHI